MSPYISVFVSITPKPILHVEQSQVHFIAEQKEKTGHCHLDPGLRIYFVVLWSRRSVAEMKMIEEGRKEGKTKAVEINEL